MTGQLIFDLPTSENYNPQDYFVSFSNNNAAKLIKIFPEWHNNGIVIFGPAKSGKTHIAHIWKSMANANLYDFKSLNLTEKLLLPIRIRINFLFLMISL